MYPNKQKKIQQMRTKQKGATVDSNKSTLLLSLHKFSESQTSLFYPWAGSLAAEIIWFTQPFLLLRAKHTQNCYTFRQRRWLQQNLIRKGDHPCTNAVCRRILARHTYAYWPMASQSTILSYISRSKRLPITYNICRGTILLCIKAPPDPTGRIAFVLLR